MLGLARAAHAHKPSDSLLALSPGAGGGSGRWDIAIRDLDDVLVLDADGDGRVTWGELRAREAEVTAYAIGRLHPAHARRRLRARDRRRRADRDPAQRRRLRLVAAGARLPVGVGAALEIDYRLLFDIDPQHRGLVRVDDGRGGAEPILLTARDHRRALAGHARRRRRALVVRRPSSRRACATSGAGWITCCS